MTERKETELSQISFREIQFTDIKELARIESLAYPEDAEAILGAQGIMGSLMLESHLRKSAQGDIPRSFLAEVDGQIAGFMLVMLNPGEGVREEHIGITQWVTAPQFRNVRLVKGMLTHLFSQGKDLPFVGQAREETTYKGLMQPGIQSWLRQQGFEVRDMHKPSEVQGDMRHPVRLQPIRK